MLTTWKWTLNIFPLFQRDSIGEKSSVGHWWEALGWPPPSEHPSSRTFHSVLVGGSHNYRDCFPKPGFETWTWTCGYMLEWLPLTPVQEQDRSVGWGDFQLCSPCKLRTSSPRPQSWQNLWVRGIQRWICTHTFLHFCFHWVRTGFRTCHHQVPPFTYPWNPSRLLPLHLGVVTLSEGFLCTLAHSVHSCLIRSSTRPVIIW